VADVVLTRGPDGKLQGMGEKGARQYQRFLAAVKQLQPGDTMRFSFKLPRSPVFHRRHFAILNAVFEQQEQFASPEAFREWVQVGAGFCDLVPGPKGKPVAIARSIAWEALEEADFAEHHAAVVGFLRSTHCTRFLWPHMDDLAADTFIDNLLRSFD
jgi:hypothetical protein